MGPVSAAKDVMKFNLSQIKDEEATLLAESMFESGRDVETVLQDIRCIDALLAMEKQYILCQGVVRKTARGYYRKNSGISDDFERIIEARVNGAFNW
jgi:hypothetical protein